ncbi:MAG: efflux RND transporter periplasmic adaptor subunit [Prevotella sp.]|nr:efflux RND transporter periplasmic adaptor subunit [Prevotella sp.]MCM1075019.1 efflux RND transporter periplasmic adaptor subunit [Ruminococcus sp.]
MEEKDKKDIQTPTAPLPTEKQVCKREKGLIIAILIVVLAIAALAVVGFMRIKPAPDTVQGQADAEEIRISGKLPGRVVELFVQEGQQVHEGDTLVHIHSSLMDAKMEQATAMQQAATATDRKVDAGTRSQIINSAFSVYQQAQAAEEITQKTYQRMENLYKEGVVTAQKRDEAKAAYDAAVAGTHAAKSQWDLAKAGAQKEDKEAAAAMVKVAQGGVKEADAMLEDQYLLAPCDGTITVIYPHESELVMTGAPIMTLQKANTYLVFNVRETLLKDVKDGTVIKVKIPALDKEIKAQIYYIQDMGSYANWQATKATGSFDARTFQVKALPTEPVENLLPGMSVLYQGVDKK